jgi:tetratricopeptide (TPR) repeat protein
MADRYDIIRELFEVPEPPSEEELQDGEEEEDAPKEGRNAQDSTELGFDKMKQGDYQAAIEHFKRAIEQSEKGDANALANLAGAYESAGMEPQAYRLYVKAAKEEATGQLHVAIGTLYRRYGRISDAVKELENAIQLEPTNPYFHFRLADTLRDAGYKVDALAAVQGAIAQEPDKPFYYYWMGDLLVDMKRFDEALEALRAAIELSPGDDLLFLLAGIAFWGAGRRAEAVRSVRLACDLESANKIHGAVLYRMLIEDGKPAEADLVKANAALLDPYDVEESRRMLKKAGIEVASLA